MLVRSARWKSFALCTLAAATVFALALTAQVGAEVAQSSDAAGSAYATAIAKAKEKRAVKLENCNKRPKAKRAGCKKAANQAYAAAKDKAQEKRDAARNPDSKGEGGPPESPVEEYHECVKAGGDPTECKEESQGGKGPK